MSELNGTKEKIDAPKMNGANWILRDPGDNLDDLDYHENPEANPESEKQAIESAVRAILTLLWHTLRQP